MPKLNHKHRKTLDSLFAHPINVNIEWWQIEHLFEALGSNVTETSHGHIKVQLNDQEETFARPKHANLADKNEVMAIRHFLERAGVTPDTV
jgi:hypothetical protein